MNASYTWNMPQQFDFFISYKWKLYKKEARKLFFALQGRGHRCFFDDDALGIAKGSEISTERLKVALEKAAKSSHWMLFFEAVKEAQVAIRLAMRSDGSVEEVSESMGAFSWQEFEAKHATKIVHIHWRRRIIERPASEQSIPFRGTGELVSAIEKFCR